MTRALFLPGANAYIRYLDLAGRHPVRVYLHGLGDSSAALLKTATHPSVAGSRSLLIDLFGCGLSDKPDRFDDSIDSHSDAIITLLEALELKDCQLVGHSLGGSIGIALASKRPDLVSTLIVAEANLDPGPGPVTGRILAQTEAAYTHSGFNHDLDRLRTMATTDHIASVTLGMMSTAAPHAIHRTARSLTGPRTPTFRDQLTTLPMRCVFRRQDRRGCPEAGIRRGWRRTRPHRHTATARARCRAPDAAREPTPSPNPSPPDSASPHERCGRPRP